MTKSIDAVVVAYRSEDHIEECIEALQRIEGLASLVVVDNGDGESARRAAAVGARTLHDPSNPGFGMGHNRGVACGAAEYLFLVNPDALVVPDPVREGVALLKSRPDAAAVQGVIVNAATGSPERSQGRELRPVHLLGRAFALRSLLRFRPVRFLTGLAPAVSDHVDRAPTSVSETEWLAATAVLMRRAAFEQVGGFSDDYFLYGEDADLCHRLRASGWRLLAHPAQWAIHQGGASAATSVDREITWWNGTMTFAARWWSPSAWSVALLASLLVGARLMIRSPSDAGRVASFMIADPWRKRRRWAGR